MRPRPPPLSLVGGAVGLLLVKAAKVSSFFPVVCRETGLWTFLVQLAGGDSCGAWSLEDEDEDEVQLLLTN